MNAITKIKALFGDVVAQDRDLGQKIDEARQKLEKLNSLPISKADYQAYVASCIDKTAEEYLERIGIQAKTDSERAYDFFKTPRAFHPVLGPNSPTGGKTPTMESLCYVFGDLIKQGHKSALQKVAWPSEVGPPLAEREKLIAGFEQEIASLEQQRAELRGVLAESGIRLD